MNNKADELKKKKRKKELQDNRSRETERRYFDKQPRAPRCVPYKIFTQVLDYFQVGREIADFCASGREQLTRTCLLPAKLIARARFY